MPFSPHCCRLIALAIVLLGSAAASALDLSRASLSFAPDASELERTAVRLLNDEIAKRTQIRLTSRERSAEQPLICLGTVRTLPSLLPDMDRTKLDRLAATENFRIWIERSGGQSRVIIA